MSDETQKDAASQASSVPQAPVADVPANSAESSAAENLHNVPRGQIESRHLVLALVIVLVGALFLALHLQSFFEDPKFRGALISTGMHKRLRAMVPRTTVDATGSVDVSLAALLGLTVTASLVAWFVGAGILALVSRSTWRALLWHWGVRYLWLYWFGVFEALWAMAGLFTGVRLENWLTTLLSSLPWIHTFVWGGWLASAFGLLQISGRTTRLARALSHPCVVWIAVAVYTGIFATLSILQYRALMVPHGDSAMYEEHLWNLLHGKGFRSQLDGGRLFFGEHLEVIHLLLIPIYVLFPSLPALNVCLTLGLACGAIAVRAFTRRLTLSDGAANWLAVAYLLYFPLQYLNLEVSLKTFRPENFGVPLLLFAIAALEAKWFRTMLGLLALTLVCKEDYAVPVGMLGLYLVTRRDVLQFPRGTRWLGLGVFLFSVLYLGFVLTIFIPAFRSGPPHYMAYYPHLGATPWEIAKNIAADPGILARPLVSGGNVHFLLTLLAPLAFLPVLGLGRLWLSLPTLLSIMLIQLDDARSPLFHFHAPLVPLLIWAAAEGLARIGNVNRGRLVGRALPAEGEPADPSPAARPLVTGVARFAAGCALVSGFFVGKSPLSLAFYDPDAGLHGFNKVLYDPNGMITWHLRNFEQVSPVFTREFGDYLRSIGRGRSFERLFPLIPLNATVAATDYIRPRFTHHRECHQYGEGRLKPHVDPESIDYIVIDLIGPYSDWRLGQRPREISERPDLWEVMHWDPEGEQFFHVLRAKRGRPDDESGPVDGE